MTAILSSGGAAIVVAFFVLARGLLRLRDRVTRLEAHADLDDRSTRSG